MSELLDDFKAVFFTPPSYSVMESFSTQVLTRMGEDERREAERLLLEAEARGTRDSRAMQGLAELKSRAALPLLWRYLPPLDRDSALWIRHPGALIDAALAVWRIDRDPKTFLYLAAIVRDGSDEYHVIHACMALRHYPFRQTIGALRSRLADRHSLVRHHAAFAMMYAAGLVSSEIESPPITIMIMQDDETSRQAAVDDLETALRDVQLPILEGIDTT